VTVQQIEDTLKVTSARSLREPCQCMLPYAHPR